MSSVLSESPSPASVFNAPVPVAYANAQKALAECERIDECKTWSDKAQALASYARQAKDDGLRLMAIRIQARAERRCGELLKQIPPANGARTDLGPAPTRGSAATDAGLSKRQQKTALRIASIPRDEFDEVIEGPSPPTVTQLAARGMQPRPAMHVYQESISPDLQLRADDALQMLCRFAGWCRGNADAEALVSAFTTHQIGEIRSNVQVIDSWLDRLVINLAGSLP